MREVKVPANRLSLRNATLGVLDGPAGQAGVAAWQREIARAQRGCCDTAGPAAVFSARAADVVSHIRGRPQVRRTGSPNTAAQLRYVSIGADGNKKARSVLRGMGIERSAHDKKFYCTRLVNQNS